ncbi:CBS domain-containing protein [Desulfovibrio mangrovi]|uniref:CBS domain-containing protein n=1 Tax=Desulfovibrio mangrovi TaxID=2976983 RepID=UPI002246609E|nr:CBS domain-containing protein [Desulfovibrio mangrovi]UZP68294.1 CBS domain-containing protein [Desulfovibrio mangrovi]
MPSNSNNNGNGQLIHAPVLITAHANADFDALAAIVAASKLYPDAVLVFPGSQERNLRNFFIESATYMFNFKQAKDIDFSSVRKLIVVDTRQRSRIPHVAAALDNPDLEIHLYDHHPESDDDLPASLSVYQSWGATTTIITLMLRDKGISVSEEEATLLGLGIFEDTGSFSFASTTEHDFAAAAWLKTKGMDLNAISELMTRELTTEQVSILSALLQSASTHDINGVSVVMAEATIEHYVGDFALLAHKMLDMENLKVLFALGRMGDRVHVVARSRLPEVDVGQICSSLGGGGHPYAASVSVKDRTLSQVKDELFALLFSSVNKQKLVRDHMSAPAVSIDDGSTIAKAEEVMNRYGLKAIPIIKKDNHFEVAGYLEYQTATRAMTHGLGNMPVSVYMQRSVQTVHPDDSLYPVMEIVVSNRQRLVPVVENGAIIGVITRTDIINTIVEEPARIPETLLPEKRRERNVKSLLRERLPSRLFTLLEVAGNLGDSLGIPVYAVGGFVRDLLLSRTNLDLDLVVESDGIAFARELARVLNGRVRAHNKFKTAVVIYKGENGNQERVDVATARLEYYEYPAALPTVELSSIKMDLYRRDFTINAQAIQLNKMQFGRLIDFFGAQRDMKDRMLRVLHSLSFVEDPTRILRAIRFEKRFDFQIGPQTTRLIKNALQLGLMDKLTGSRIFNEVDAILHEGRPLACLRRMEEFGILTIIHPQLRLTQTKEQVLGELESVASWYRLLYLSDVPEPWMLYLMGLLMNATYVEVKEVAARFNLTKRQEEDFLTLRENIREGITLLNTWGRHDRTMSGLYRTLSPIGIEGLLFIMARTKADELRKSISHYLTHLRGMKIDISGEDLRIMGAPPGPAYGRVLSRVLAAKLDGEVPTRQMQLELAMSLILKETEKDAEYFARRKVCHIPAPDSNPAHAVFSEDIPLEPAAGGSDGPAPEQNEPVIPPDDSN